MMNKKTIIPILILLMVIIVGVVSYLALNTKSPTLKNQLISSSSPTQEVSSSEINKQILEDIENSGVICETEDPNSGVIKDSCKIDKVIGNYAKGLMPQAYWIATKIDNRWRVVITGNGIPQCEEIDNNNIPKEIYGNCIESSGQLRF